MESAIRNHKLVTEKSVDTAAIEKLATGKIGKNFR